MKLNYSYSVALCTYNGERYIADQLESILKQSVLPKEIIISDDGSRDNTLRIANDLLNKSTIKYKIVNNSGTPGVVGNFSNAISLCSEKVIFTSDQDDVWMLNKAETMLKVFEENEKALLVFSNGELVDENLKSLKCDMWKSVGITKEMIENTNWFKYMSNRCLVTGAAMAFKRELFSVEEKIPSCWLHDGWLAWKAVAKDGLVPCREKLIFYRQHGGNVVGMNSVKSITRIKSYFVNFRTIQKSHSIRHDRYLEIKKYMGQMFSDREQEELQECIVFWRDLMESDKCNNRLKRVRIICKHLKNKDFEKYFNGRKGFMRELILAILF